MELRSELDARILNSKGLKSQLIARLTKVLLLYQIGIGFNSINSPKCASLHHKTVLNATFFQVLKTEQEKEEQQKSLAEKIETEEAARRDEEELKRQEEKKKREDEERKKEEDEVKYDDNNNY